MNAILSRIFSALVFPSARRKAWRTRTTIRKLSPDNEIEICDEDLARIKLKVVGTGNRIVVKRMLKSKGTLNITVVGSGCSVEIGEGMSIERSLGIFIGNPHKDFGPVEDVSATIGRDVGFNGCATIMTYNSHARIEIGEKCLFGADVTMYQTDGHPVYEMATGRMTNHVGTMHIGKHVWTGAHAAYLKNVFIPDDCIVGFGSVVTRRFTEPNSVISGNPATCVRTGMAWKSCDPAYIANDGTTMDNEAKRP